MHTANDFVSEDLGRTLDALSDLVCVLDSSHKIRWANVSMARKLGVDPAEAVGMTCYEAVHGTTSPPDSCPCRQLLQDRREHSCEVHEERLGGDFLVTCVPIMNGSGRFKGVIHIARDITESKRLEDALLQERNLYKDLVVSQPSGVYRLRIKTQKPWSGSEWVGRVESNYHLEMVSDLFCEILGATREQCEANAAIVVESIHPEDLPGFVERNVIALENLKVFKWEGRLKVKGKITWVYFASVPRCLDDGDVIWTGILLDITGLKHAESELRKSQLITENIPVGMYLYHLEDPSDDRTLRMVYANPAVKALTGIGPEEVVGRTLDENFPGLRAQGIPQRYAEVVRTQTPTTFDDIIYGDDRVMRASFSIKAFPLSGNHVGVVFDNITEYKRAERELLSNYALLQIAAETAHFGGWSVDLVDHTCTWSNAVADIHEVPRGYSPPMEEGINFYAPEWRERIIQVFSACVKDGVHYDEDMEIITRKEKRVWVRTTGKAVRDAEGKIVKIHGSFQDITEQKRTQEALRASEERLRLVITVANDGFWDWNLITNEVYFDPRYYLISGYEVDEFPHRLEEFQKRIHPDNLANVMAEAEKHLNGKSKRFDVTFRFLKKDGGYMWILGKGQIVERDQHGKPLRFVGTHTDITEQKRSEDEKAKLQSQVVQAQKMESVGRLAGGVAHDFNNMLGVILGNVEFLLRENTLDQDGQAPLEEIRKAAQRSADLTRQLLTFARKQTVTPKLLDLNTTLEGMLKMLQRLIGEDIDLVWRPGTNLWPVFVDPSQVDQVLANLCVNARDAIADTGKITIETNNISFDKAYCAENAGFVPGDFVMLAVSDDGCGMDCETLGHLFEPFFTTKDIDKGTGLGLATVDGAVRQNKGFIKVYSEPGHGAIFKIYLPRHTANAVLRAEQPVSATATGGETILLVEDEPAILNITSRMLKKMGYTVIEAVTPGEAIRLAMENHGKIELLITDVVMPEMNGRDLAGNIMSIYPGIKHLFMSGYTANVIAHHGVLNHGVHFIQKPFTTEDLAARVREALEA